jgi:hypothetical protein
MPVDRHGNSGSGGGVWDPGGQAAQLPPGFRLQRLSGGTNLRPLFGTGPRESAGSLFFAPQSGGIGAVPGYPETGPFSWRAANDAIFTNAANQFNAANHFSPSDPAYVTPMQLKTQAMVESGGVKNKAAFLSDPLQVNNHGDYTTLKRKVTGLSDRQPMTPQTSAEAALKWFLYKSQIHDDKGKVTGYRNRYDSMKRYNAKRTIDRRTGERHDDSYASRIVGPPARNGSTSRH